MSVTWIIVIVAIAFVFEMMIAALILRTLIRGSWIRLQERFPKRDPATSAVRRNFQSFKLGMLNLGLSVHVEADNRYLHLHPTKFLRIFGGGTISVPWQEVRVTKVGRNHTHAIIGGIKSIGPTWCLELAATG